MIKTITLPKSLQVALAVFISFSFICVGCATAPAGNAKDIGPSVADNARKESYVNGIIYQLSAEVKGLQMQAYKLARIRLEDRLQEQAQGKYSKPLAIVTDLDETILSDTMYLADAVQRPESWDNGPFDKYYYAGLSSVACKAIPGAVDFFNYASSKGIEIFYITNRDPDKGELTVKQLQYLGFPNADKDHIQVKLQDGSSNKTQRRNNVLKDHDVIMYLGDNIGDFTGDFKTDLGPVKRTELALQAPYTDFWGDKWIVFPNATYGNYVSAVWYGDKKADAAKRVEYIKQLFDSVKFTNTEKFGTWYKE
ncbi:5'-nucleotidase, lipoprotein e(P4) family [Treponema sp.]|uniref:5'-nucleotidase, lipoprotein e(P4) family n=1 Tax=Treponema sp. TaxID=166 RepID=UPI003FA2899B